MIKNQHKLTQERLKELLHYDKETGIFTRIVSRGPIKAGSIIDGRDNRGYVVLKIDWKTYFAHRVAWLYVYGFYSENGIDHIDRIKHHNWIDNLREASQQCNMRNCNVRKGSKSGVTGVTWNKPCEKWQAGIHIDGADIYLGRYINIEDAVRRRLDAEVRHKWPNCNTTSSAYIYLKERGLI